MSQKKDKEPILFKESVYKVAEIIFNYPNKTFYIRMLARKSGLSTTAVEDALKLLRALQIIRIEETSLTKNVKADFDSADYTAYKLIFNLYQIKKYAIAEQLTKILNPQTIILFGSYAKGEDIEESDIDILVIANDIRTIKKKETDNTSIIQFEKIFNRKINIHVLPNLERSSSEFKNAVANGIVLHGYLTVI